MRGSIRTEQAAAPHPNPLPIEVDGERGNRKSPAAVMQRAVLFGVWRVKRAQWSFAFAGRSVLGTPACAGAGMPEDDTGGVARVVRLLIKAWREPA
ncbi:MAG: hypothetical protein B7Y80_11545 [Hyphomicrobium sp. 32-62-53]|nr:MAG: hypothetical protein B7Y80_11545 [Hyphomicrobium sp. 32-62-53]